jgi:hypothetical protein
MIDVETRDARRWLSADGGGKAWFLAYAEGV